MIKKILNTIMYGFAIIGAIVMLSYLAAQNKQAQESSQTDNRTDYRNIWSNFKKDSQLINTDA